MALKYDPATELTVRQAFVKDIASQLAKALSPEAGVSLIEKYAAAIARQAVIIADAAIEEERRTASTRIVHEKPLPQAIPVEGDELVGELGVPAVTTLSSVREDDGEAD